MPYADHPDGSVHYEVEGTGPGLALVHGVGGSAEGAFGTVVKALARDRTVVRPNLSGSGGTTDGGGPLSLTQLAEQTVSAIDDAVDGPVDLLGFSLGGAVAATVAANHPGLVNRLILVGSWAYPDPRHRFYFETWAKLLSADLDLFRRFTTLTGFSPTAVNGWGHEGLAASLDNHAWPEPGISRQIEVALGIDIRGLLPSITAPTAVIGFSQDEMIPVEGSQQLHAGIPGSTLTEIEGQGHMDWIGDPDQMIALIRGILS
ncbi:alpha/beta fold hydrolase [Streptomyces albipurpureus]|uniref:Alpha/beta hydrolase n=1 Tax=Streptomyces albipurpureus TaxID=2897419 RepID=A0ABT0UTG2_9ACTN|nr:alpha/beta hydrolase [Streptomyces sp. CWNU-1]MCM2390521.1 alpha/beta hydrolase [Streptomyces sp. CWNU-1]